MVIFRNVVKFIMGPQLELGAVMALWWLDADFGMHIYSLLDCPFKFHSPLQLN